jgi:hypothetical protein
LTTKLLSPTMPCANRSSSLRGGASSGATSSSYIL